jgi:DNA-binding transcriptional regulator GbsR (MarR family)
MPLQLNAKLFEDLAEYYGKIYHLSPLSSKVYACLAFDFTRKGISFEDLQKKLGVSKSSVSQSLKILEDLHLITYTYKEHSRVRLFSLNSEYALCRFSKLIDNMQLEKELIARMVAEKKKQKTENEKLDAVFNLYTDTLTKNIALLEETMKTLQSIVT